MSDTASILAAVNNVLNRLEGVRQTGSDRWQARCPAHDDRHPSLSISIGDNGAVLLHCHANCAVENILAQLGLSVRDLFPARDDRDGYVRAAHRRKPAAGNGAARKIVASYDYVNAEGDLLFECVRFIPKDFKQRRPDDKGGWIWNLKGIQLLLYRMPDLLSSRETDADAWVFVCEGEKDCDRLATMGFIATCNPMGAGKWKDEYSETLRGRRCCIIADKDEPGRRHVQQVATSLANVAADVRVIECPGDGVKDASDFFDKGRTVDELLRLVEAAPTWEPQTDGQDTSDNGDVVVHATLDATELALAREVHRRRRDDLRYDVERGQFRIWSGSRWQLDLTGQVVRWVKDVARQTRQLFAYLDERNLRAAVKRMESAAGIGGILMLLRTEPGVCVTSAQFDRDAMLLNVGNGTLDLRTGTLRPHDRRDMLTRQIPTIFTADATAPIWSQFLNRVMAGNPKLIEYLQRIVGLSLTGVSKVQELYICYGIGANGKSVFVDTVCGLLGDYAGTAPDSLLIARERCEHPTEIADLLGKRLVVASEAEDGGKLRLQLIKKLTGDTRLKARFMRQDYFEFDRTHKLIMVTNHKPRVSETTEAAWRRIRLIPFDVIIPPDERDADLLSKLRNEYPGILACAVRGCLDWQANGMQSPDEVLIATAEYRAEADTFADYVAERLIQFAGARVSRADLWADYQAWAAKSPDRLDRRGLYDRIRQLDGVTEGVSEGVRRFECVGLCHANNTGGADE